MNNNIAISRDLVRKCQNGDTTAFNEVYATCSRGVFNSILRVVKHREEAEDLLQETFISAFQNMQNYRGEASLFGWIKRIGMNKSLNALKKRKLEFEYFETDIEEEGSEETKWEELKLNVNDVMTGLEQLPDGFRIVLSLYLFEEYTHKEIADELGISENTSKSQYLRGKKKLKELLLSQYERG